MSSTSLNSAVRNTTRARKSVGFTDLSSQNQQSLRNTQRSSILSLSQQPILSQPIPSSSVIDPDYIVLSKARLVKVDERLLKLPENIKELNTNIDLSQTYIENMEKLNLLFAKFNIPKLSLSDIDYQPQIKRIKELEQDYVKILNSISLENMEDGNDMNSVSDDLNFVNGTSDVNDLNFVNGTSNVNFVNGAGKKPPTSTDIMNMLNYISVMIAVQNNNLQTLKDSLLDLFTYTSSQKFINVLLDNFKYTITTVNDLKIEASLSEGLLGQDKEDIINTQFEILENTFQITRDNIISYGGDPLAIQRLSDIEYFTSVFKEAILYGNITQSIRNLNDYTLKINESFGNEILVNKNIKNVDLFRSIFTVGADNNIVTISLNNDKIVVSPKKADTKKGLVSRKIVDIREKVIKNDNDFYNLLKDLYRPGKIMGIFKKDPTLPVKTFINNYVSSKVTPYDIQLSIFSPEFINVISSYVPNNVSGNNVSGTGTVSGTIIPIPQPDLEIIKLCIYYFLIIEEDMYRKYKYMTNIFFEVVNRKIIESYVSSIHLNPEVKIVKDYINNLMVGSISGANKEFKFTPEDDPCIYKFETEDDTNGRYPLVTESNPIFTEDVTNSFFNAVKSVKTYSDLVPVNEAFNELRFLIFRSIDSLLKDKLMFKALQKFSPQSISNDYNCNMTLTDRFIVGYMKRKYPSSVSGNVSGNVNGNVSGNVNGNEMKRIFIFNRIKNGFDKIKLDLRLNFTDLNSKVSEIDKSISSLLLVVDQTNLTVPESQKFSEITITDPVMKTEIESKRDKIVSLFSKFVKSNFGIDDPNSLTDEELKDQMEKKDKTELIENINDSISRLDNTKITNIFLKDYLYVPLREKLENDDKDLFKFMRLVNNVDPQI